LTAPNKRLERTRHEQASLLSNLGEPLKRNVRLLRRFSCSREMEQLIAHKDEAPFDRKLFSLSIPTLESFPLKLELPSLSFVLLLACDARGIGDSVITGFANSMIDKGVAYLCAWGPECERIHDLFDLAFVKREIEERQQYPQVMTSWHHDESLDEALWFMLFSAYPDEAFADSCGVDLAVSVANDEWHTQIQRRLSNIKSFNEEMLSQDEVR
jgi:hypothetical protein